MKCLRSKTVDDIAYATFYIAKKKFSPLKVKSMEPWGPYLDDTYIRQNAFEMLRTCQFKSKPLIIGNTAQEMAVMRFANVSVSTVMYMGEVLSIRPSDTLLILSMYPPLFQEDESIQMTKLSTDLLFTCSIRNVTQSVAIHQHSNIYVYVWEQVFSYPIYGKFSACNNYVCHGTELPFLFKVHKHGKFDFTDEELSLSKRLAEFWTNFAKTGNPNDPDDGSNIDIQWPEYTQGNGWPVYAFKNSLCQVYTDYRKRYCDFWDSVGYDVSED